MILKFIVFFCPLAIAHTRIEKRIHGGRDTEPYTFPNIVAMYKIINPEIEFLGKLICSGIIYNENWVVLAAICSRAMIYVHLLENVRVAVGKWNLSQVEPFQQIRSIERIFVHEDFEEVGIANSVNLAILKVNESLTFNEYVKSFPFSSNFTYPTGFGIIIGWGCRTEEDYNIMKTANILNFLIVHVKDFDKCKLYIQTQMAKLGIQFEDKKFNKYHFCSGTFTDVFLGPGAGDHGGPFMQLNADRKYVVVGVISVGARRPNLGVYTHVAPFISWFNTTIEMYS